MICLYLALLIFQKHNIVQYFTFFTQVFGDYCHSYVRNALKFTKIWLDCIDILYTFIQFNEVTDPQKQHHIIQGSPTRF